MSYSSSIKLGALLLAGASMFAATAPASAQCSTAAWDSVSGTATAGSPPTVKRYSGSCGLAPATAGGYVLESTNHAAEGSASPFSARFYVYTGVTAGTPVIYQATSDDAGTTPVIEIAYDASQQNFDFTVNGSTASTTAGSAPQNKWIGVEFQYQTGQAFTANTMSGGTLTSLSGGPTAGADTIEAAKLGVITSNGATGSMYFDEYEASRASGSATPIAPICRGDANNDSFVNVFDTIQVINERLNGTLVAGNSDCNEDGSVNVFDTICVINQRLAGGTCN